MNTVFIVELTTRDGRVCERYDTYAEARKRVEQFPAASLVGHPCIFAQLPDGSERLVREDGKPLQFHRGPAEEVRGCADDPLPLAEDAAGLVGPDGKLRLVAPHPPEDGWEDLPLV
jgi:hypothetical protein